MEHADIVIVIVSGGQSGLGSHHQRDGSAHRAGRRRRGTRHRHRRARRSRSRAGRCPTAGGASTRARTGARAHGAAGTARRDVAGLRLDRYAALNLPALVLAGTRSFEVQRRNCERDEIVAWSEHDLPFLVAIDDDGTVLGFARVSPYGFHEVGVQRRHGRLDGKWKDCVLVERLLGEAAVAV